MKDKLLMVWKPIHPAMLKIS